MLEPLRVLIVDAQDRNGPPASVLASLQGAGYSPDFEFANSGSAISHILSRKSFDAILVFEEKDQGPTVQDVLANSERFRKPIPTFVLQAPNSRVPAILRSGVADYLPESDWAGIGLSVVRARSGSTTTEPQDPGSAVQRLPLPACTITPGGEVLDANEEFATVVGKADVSEVLGRSLASLGASALLKEEAPPSPHVWLDGLGEALLHLESNPETEVKTLVLWPLGEGVKILDPEEHERQLADTRNLRLIAEAATDFTLCIRDAADDVARIEWASDSFTELMAGHRSESWAGLEAGEAELGAVVSEVVHPDDRIPLLRAMVAVQLGERRRLFARLKSKDQEYGSFALIIVPALDDRNGLSVVVSGISLDREDDPHGRLARTEEQLAEVRAELEADRELARESAERYRTYVASLTHEIRTPLTGIIGFAEVLSEEVGDQHREMASSLARSGRLLLDVLQSVLLLARIEDHGEGMRIEELDLRDQGQRVIDALEPLAEARGLELTFDAPTRVRAAVDRTAVTRILMNVVGNGIKYTDEGGVKVRVTARGENAVVEIEDSGVGIEQDFIPRLFDPFSREARDATNERPGSGLGLMITHRLCTLLGATISVDSERDVGTTVRITFPRGVDEEALPDLPALFDSDHEADIDPADPAASESAGGEYRVRSLLDESQVPDGDGFDEIDWEDPQRTAWIDEDRPKEEMEIPMTGDGAQMAAGLAEDQPAEAPPESNLPRLLVVEDNEEARLLLSRILKPHYSVETVHDARTALEAMAGVQYDVLLLDIHLGGRQTGGDVLRIARTLPGYEHVPALAVTAFALPGDEGQFLSSGFDGYVSKPFTVDVLLQALKRAGAPMRVGG